jgi:3-oxoadipate enol-lactonase
LHELVDLDPDDAFAIRMRITDRRWDPDADEPMPGVGAYYDQMVAGMRATPDPDALAGLRRQLAARAGHDVTARLSTIDHPTLVCAGRYDDIAPVENSEYLVERMRNAELRVFDGGHLFMLQDRTVWPTIEAFLGSPS